MKQAPVYIKIDEDGDKCYYRDKKMTRLHRLDGPAIAGARGYKAWWQNGRRHRLNGPAIEWPGGTKEWWQNGKRHRTDGPAIEWSSGAKAWYIDNNELTEAEFLAETA